MPFSGSTFEYTSGTVPGPANAVISSSKTIQRDADILAALNTTTSVARGGTGATTVITAHDALVTAGSDIASSGTINLTTATGAFVDITGTTSITVVTLAEGSQRIARAAGIFKLTAGASLVINGSTTKSYTTAVGDLLFFSGDGSSVARVSVAQTNTPQNIVSINGGPLGGFRNKIINGDFEVAQRGTSQTASGYGSVDRWLLALSGAAGTMSQQAHTVGQTDVPGNPANFLRLNITSANDDVYIDNRIEGVETFAGKLVTFTAWMKHTTTAATSLNPRLLQYFGTGGSPSSIVETEISTTVTTTTSWVKHSITATLPSISGKTLGTNGDNSLILRLENQNNETFDFDLSHVSLVEGDATAEDDPFSPLHIAQVQDLCERYYEVITLGSLHIGTGDASHNFRQGYWRTLKRSAPTITHTLTVSSGGAISVSGTTVSGFRYGRGGDSSTMTGVAGDVNGDSEL